MVDASLFNALTAREYMNDKVMEAYLVSKPGLLGAIGFRKIAESYEEISQARDEALRERDSARKELEGVGLERDGLQNALKDALEKIRQLEEGRESPGEGGTEGESSNEGDE